MKHYAIPALFAFGPSIAASAPEIHDEAAPEVCGEAEAIRVLYQRIPPAPAKKPRRGTPIRDFFADLVETLFPRPLVPAYARVRQNVRR